MKVFKAIFLSALTTFIFSYPSFSQAFAESAGYAYADVGAKVYFCDEKDRDRALFIIPQTYCIEILGEEDGWYRCKYADDGNIYRALYGYCEKQGLIPSHTPPENLYLNRILTVTLSAGQSSSILPPLKVEMQAAYYGEFVVGGVTVSYVYCGGTFGYVPETVEDYPLNDLPKPAVSGDAVQQTGDNAMLIIALVLSVGAATAITVLYFTGKKTPKNPKD